MLTMLYRRFFQLSLLTTIFVAVPVTRADAQNAAPQYSSVFGGSGGDAFTRDCGPGRVLAGIRGRSYLFVDAIGILCRPVNADGKLGPPTAVGTLAGGGGGTSGEAICPSYAPAMIGIKVKHGAVVDLIIPQCGAWNEVSRTHSFLNTMPGGVGRTSDPNVAFRCGSANQPGAGIRGRAKGLVDAIGMICDEP
jgi:hypothetical protein